MKLILLILLAPLSLLAQNDVEGNSNSGQAISFIQSLNEAQKKKALFSFSEMNRYEWHYVPASLMGRRGISFFKPKML